MPRHRHLCVDSRDKIRFPLGGSKASQPSILIGRIRGAEYELTAAISRSNQLSRGRAWKIVLKSMCSKRTTAEAFLFLLLMFGVSGCSGGEGHSTSSGR